MILSSSKCWYKRKLVVLMSRPAARMYYRTIFNLRTQFLKSLTHWKHHQWIKAEIYCKAIRPPLDLHAGYLETEYCSSRFTDPPVCWGRQQMCCSAFCGTKKAIRKKLMAAEVQYLWIYWTCWKLLWAGREDRSSPTSWILKLREKTTRLWQWSIS